MKIENKILISIDESDIIAGVFTNKDVIGVADNCFDQYHGYCPKSLTKVVLPRVTQIGNDNFRGDAFTSVRIGKHDLTVKGVDNTCFVVDSQKSTKGIKLYTGYILVKIKDSVITKNPGFLAEKEGFYAHGATVKKSIADLQFKIVSERLRKEPIKPETKITVAHYRLITGACEMGVRNWMEQNGLIGKEKMTASELLPILKKTNAYGFEKFKQLMVE